VSAEDRFDPKHGRRDPGHESATRVRIALAWIAACEAWLTHSQECSEGHGRALEALRCATRALDGWPYGQGIGRSESVGPKDAPSPEAPVAFDELYPGWYGAGRKG